MMTRNTTGIAATGGVVRLRPGIVSFGRALSGRFPGAC